MTQEGVLVSDLRAASGKVYVVDAGDDKLIGEHDLCMSFCVNAHNDAARGGFVLFI